MRSKILILILYFLFLGIIPNKAEAEAKWKITAYCACKLCCGPKAKGITASGKKVKSGMIALNWLPFGTKVKILTLGTFIVEDRGAKSLFGTKNNHIKHIDVYIPNHKEALKFGIKYLNVIIEP